MCMTPAALRRQGLLARACCPVRPRPKVTFFAEPIYMRADGSRILDKRLEVPQVVLKQFRVD
jgi:hypothetical protein